MDIPYQVLDEDVLKGIVEEFVLREGTDYGPRQFSLEEKVADVYQALQRGTAKIVFESETETCNIVAVRR